MLTVQAAIASNLANGLDVVQAVKRACRYVEAGIKVRTSIQQWLREFIYRPRYIPAFEGLENDPDHLGQYHPLNEIRSPY